MFKTFDANIIRECHFFMNTLLFELLLDVRRLNFLDNINNIVMFDLDNSEIDTIICKYGFLRDVK